jgi:3',5'-cyclic AMP phosphodiesterase CpdA
MRIIHLTDPHLSRLPSFSAGRFLFTKRFFGALSWSRRKHHHLRAQLDLLMKEIQIEAPDLIICTGDLVQIGTEEEVVQAKGWLNELSSICRVVLVPGNHDCYQHDSHDYIMKHWASDFFGLSLGGDDFPSMFRSGAITFIGLSSAQAEPFWSARGSLGKRQLRRLEDILDDSSDGFRCVFLHHPPIPGRCANRKSLRDANLLSELLKTKKVEMVLHGHVHRNQMYSANEYTKVFATASASNVAKSAPASYRVFEVEKLSDDWIVREQLKVLDPSVNSEAATHVWSSGQ